MIDDDILDVSDALDDWLRPKKVKTVTTTTVDFVKQQQVVVRQQECMVQPAEKEKLRVEGIDWSLKYILVHSKEKIAIAEYIEHNGEDYKVIAPADWDGYGYCAVIAEQTKKALLEPTS